MAGQATIRNSLQIVFDTSVGQVDYNGQPTQFTDDLSAVGGPTPGQIVATVAGTDVDLSELASPGWCRIRNIGDYTVHVGIYDPQTFKFYPMIQVKADQFQVIELSSELFQEYGTGTGTTGPDTNTLRVKAETASTKVVVEAFER